jgi:hypothetical protein
MRTKLIIGTFVFFLSVLILMPVSAIAADISGRWTGPATSPSGTPLGDRIFTFKIAGDKVTGTIITQQTVNATFEVEGQPKMVGKLTTQSGIVLEIQEGKITGNEVSFVTVSRMGQNEIKTNYKGIISDNEIKFTAEMQMPAGMMMPPMGGPGSSQGGQPQAPRPQEFVAKRMNQ